MSKIENLIAAQQSYLDQILKIWTNFQKLAKPKRNLSAVRNRLLSLQKFRDNCQARHEEIFALSDPKLRLQLDYFVNDAFSEINECAEEVRDSLTEVLNSLTEAPERSTPSDPNDASEVRKPSVTLPPINVPKFAGELMSWPGFRDLFASLVDARKDLSDIEKLHYLKASLEGKASAILRTMEVTEANYKAAWDLLKKRYENPRAIVYAYLDAFIAIPKVGSHRERDLSNLRDRAHEIYHAILSLSRPINMWEDQFIHLLLSKLDAQTRLEWELTQDDVSKFPEFKDLDNYLSLKLRAFETVGPNNTVSVFHSSPNKEGRRNCVKVHQASSVKPNCFICSGEHPLFQCSDFLSHPVHKRIELITSQERCLNCFRQGHRPRACNSKNVCRICKLKHNTLVHINGKRKNTSSTAETPTHGAINTPREERLISTPSTSGDVSINCTAASPRHTMLPTATVLLRSTSGRSVQVRALLDQGSQASFIAASVVQMLKLARKPVNVSVSGIGSTALGSVKRAASFSVEPCNGDGPITPMSALILPSVSSYLPPPITITSKCDHLTSLRLADNNISDKEPVRLIIGADYYGSFLREGLIWGPPGTPVAQLTIFGWILSGHVSNCREDPPQLTVNHSIIDDDLNSSLAKFWELEEIPKTIGLSESELQCENHFVQTHTRLQNGQYLVRLPFKSSTHIPVGDTRTPVTRMYLQQELRLNKNPQLYAAYNQFLSDYHSLGHMTRVSPTDEEHRDAVYLPHHPVVKDSSSTTKVRVVFNASFHVAGFPSLNDLVHVGPKLQANLFAIILRWRSYRFVYIADLKQMFRQIPVHSDDVDFQRILWRSSSVSPVEVFQLRTVTYGTACAPYLANRVIRQLVEDEGLKFPLAASVLKDNIYVDDIMFGADDLNVLIHTQCEVRQLLTAGGFSTHKWAANHATLESALPSEMLEQSRDKTLSDDIQLKVLGVYWHPPSDSFSFKVNVIPEATTKRAFLSLLARIFDPLGWVSPIVISAKIILQLLWLKKLGWDDTLPKDMAARCCKFQEELPLLNGISLRRWTGQSTSTHDVEVHGFCDASNVAYSAVIYIRTRSESDSCSVSLLYAKTKVAPLKLQSIPRLELCAASLLTRALDFVIPNMGLAAAPLHCWTDSSVVLAWLKSPPARWKTFVANRVSEVQSAFPNAMWHHVPTSENPADCASRGILPSQLLNHPLWWHGPSWLSLQRTHWPLSQCSDAITSGLEERTITPLLAFTCTTELELPENTSSWPKLLRVTAYVFRFIYNSRRKEGSRIAGTNLVQSEISAALRYWCKQMQSRHYGVTVKEACKPAAMIKHRNLRSLNLFVDPDGLLRVGGRLRYSSRPEEEKFPILLPPCRISTLIAQHFHEQTLHGGLQVTLRLMRQQFWIIRSRSIVKKCIYNCVKCTRYRASLSTQKMGDLPRSRVTPSRPFSHTGVDYAGPFQIRSNKGRGHRTHKAYCVLFVCLTVRAVHLEVADDYTTAGFLAAFDRFVSRRGLPSNVYSDNGTNFVGAERELSVNFRRVTRDPDLLNKLASDGIEWTFIPPAAPHFGGLWEAGVKSVKHHLKRVMGNFTPTYEEFSTLLCKIEGILNSRPLAPLYDDPDTYDALTPGHFLVGSLLKAVPIPSVLSVNENRLTRWQTIQRFQEAFWKIWSADYLNSLQQRLKWRSIQPNLCVDDLVLIRNTNLPPAKWELGRVSKCFPGADGLVRVVLVRTAKSEYKRPINQLCKLPLDSRTVEDPAPHSLA